MPSHPRVPHEVSGINHEIARFMNTEDERGNKIGGYQNGVYAFFDYDSEPIYVGKTVEGIRTRIGRHLTGRRSDAVAKSILDPFEVAFVEVIPFPELEGMPKIIRSGTISRAEYTLYLDVISRSQLGAVLNEIAPQPTDLIELPTVYRTRIIPDDLFVARSHPDVRLARRASTVANLARIISERDVKVGIRRTLLTQAKRIELLASRRLADFAQEASVAEESESETDRDNT